MSISLADKLAEMKKHSRSTGPIRMIGTHGTVYTGDDPRKLAAEAARSDDARGNNDRFAA